jgi:hypothetical protein
LQEREALADLRQDVAGDELVAVSTDGELLEMPRGMIDRQPCEVGDWGVLKTHGTGLVIEAGTVAGRAFHKLLVLHPLDLAIGVHLGLEHGFVARGIEVKSMLRHHPVTAALRAPAMRRVEREEPRIEFFEGFVAARATRFGGQEDELLVRRKELQHALADIESPRDCCW